MVCLRKLGPPTSYGLDEKKEKINLPLPSNDGNLRKGNLEIVEPGELVSSERLKMIKNNLKRNLTSNYTNKFSISKYDKNNFGQSSHLQTNSFNLSSGKKYKEEIIPKMKIIFKRKDEGLFNKKKHFNILSKNSHNSKIEMNLDIRPQVKKASYAPVIFLTKSIEENNEEETSNTNDNVTDDNNNLNKELNKEKSTKNNDGKTIIEKNKDAKDIDNENIDNNKNYSIIGNNKVIKDTDNKNIIINKEGNSSINNTNKENIVINNDNNNNNKNIENKNIKSEEKVKKPEEEEEEEEEEEKEEIEKNNKSKEKDNEENKKKVDEKNEKIKISVNNKNEENSKIENNNIDDINISEKKEQSIINENDNLKYIIKTIHKIDKAQNNIVNLMKSSPLNNSDNDYIADNYIQLLNDHKKKIKAYQLFMLYKIFNENDDYYIKRNSFNKWKRNNLIFIESNNDKHIKLYDGHCLLCYCEEDYNLNNQNICLSCNCNEIKRILKNILIKHKFLREMNPIKYYFYMWCKSVI